ncbi:hypothetical protein FA15DRAFT_673796 [Coprinopsis marcescibilis]|uniref:Uncharacterized protein n=1 Tax=Coprinopsis marcescibilis TaxID=230819 RepID=A0A5C3KJ75_COPMA|nr:hypothetical protein FA15DRAFT_673796 [Coprinopsis marcescibilis]
MDPRVEECTPALPVEILEKVLGELCFEAFPSYQVNMEDVDTTPLSDQVALDAAFKCSLASHFFRARLFPYIFYRSTISTLDSLKDLLSLMQSNPSIATHIKCLQLHERNTSSTCNTSSSPASSSDSEQESPPETPQKEIKLGLGADSPTWLISSSNDDPAHMCSLLLTISATSALRELSIIQCISDGDSSMDYPRVSKPFPGPPPLHSALSRLIPQPQLRAVRLRGLMLAIDSIEWMRPTLEYFSADYIGIERDYFASSDGSVASWAPIVKYKFKQRVHQLPFRVVQLADGIPGEISRLPLRRRKALSRVGSKFLTPLPNLERLVFYSPIMDCNPGALDKWDILAPKLRTVSLNLNHGRSESLKSSRLKFDHLCVPGPFTTVEIDRFIGPGGNGLRYLKLKDKVPGNIGVFLSTHSSNVSKPCKLRTLKLVFKCANPSHHITPARPLWDHIKENIEWPGLDEVLAGPFFRHLREITVNVGRFGISANKALELESRLKSYLPLVQEAHRVSIRVEP